MRAALALLGQATLGPRGRRIAVLGDMLELGADGERLHRELADAVVANDVDLVFCCRAADAAICGRLFPPNAGAAMPETSVGARIVGARGGPAGRRRDGQGLARLAHGPSGQGAGTPLPLSRRRFEGVRLQG